MYDNNAQRKNLTNYCAARAAPTRPTATPGASTSTATTRSTPGSTATSAPRRAAPATSSRARRSPPSRRSRTSSGSWTRSRTSSSRTTSTPTAATSCGRRAPTSAPTASRRPAPNIGIEKYFFEAGEKILARIKEHRNTVILPERTGPIADVLYSAAGNSADEQWYRKGIISYSFETGADRFITNPTTGAVSQIDHRLPALLRGRGHRRRHRHLQHEPDQRGSRPGDGVRRRQLRHGRVRVRLRDGHEGPEDAPSRSPPTRARSRSTSSSTGTTRPRSSTTRPTARRRPCRRRSTTTSAPAPIGEVLDDHQARRRPRSSGWPWT